MITAARIKEIQTMTDRAVRDGAGKRFIAGAMTAIPELVTEVEQLTKRLAEIPPVRENYTDESGTTWRPPTAWAYAKTCQIMNQKSARVAALEAAFLPLLEACEQDFTNVHTEGPVNRDEDDSTVAIGDGEKTVLTFGHIRAARKAFTPEPNKGVGYRWEWRLSTDGGESYNDEFETREQAVEAATSTGGGMIAECIQQEYHLNVSGEDVVELLANQNSDLMGEDGEIFTNMTGAAQIDLGASVTAAISQWADRHDIYTTAWVFAGVRNQETIVVEAPADQTEEAAQ